MFPIVTMTVTWIVVVARLIIAVQLTRVARRQKLPNLLWLAAFFYLTGIGDIFATLAPVTNIYQPFTILTGVGEIVMVMFIQKTFYQDRKSPFPIFMGLALIVLAADILYAVYLPYHSPFNWLWLLWAGYQAYRRIVADQAVDDWIKARYKLVIAYSGLSLVAPLWTILFLIAMVVPTVAAFLYAPTNVLIAQVGILAFVTAGIVLQYLAWVMPERYREWLNRNYQPPVQEAVEANLTEEEIMRQLTA